MPITPTKKIWMDGEFVDWDKATTHVLTHTLHYGTGAFEGIRAYKTPTGLALSMSCAKPQRRPCGSMTFPTVVICVHWSTWDTARWE